MNYCLFLINVLMILLFLLQTVSHLPECVDSQVQDVLKKIRRHIDVLEQGSTKVSSRAEVFGAVQQVIS